MPSIGIRRDVVHVLQAFKKTTQATSRCSIERARQRLREIQS